MTTETMKTFDELPKPNHPETTMIVGMQGTLVLQVTLQNSTRRKFLLNTVGLILKQL